MITVHASGVRAHGAGLSGEVWRGYPGVDSMGLPPGGFGALELVVEARLPLGAALTNNSSYAGEVITYVREGGLACPDVNGATDVIDRGEFQCAAATASPSHVANHSRTDDTHAFQFWLTSPMKVIKPRLQKKSFEAHRRRGQLCLVASPEMRQDSLQLQQDVRLYSAILAQGQQLDYVLLRDRCAWLHVVQGQLLLQGMVLSTGDGAGIFNERSISMVARADTELLLIDSTERVWAVAHRPADDRTARHRKAKVLLPLRQEGSPMGDKSPKDKEKKSKRKAARTKKDADAAKAKEDAAKKG